MAARRPRPSREWGRPSRTAVLLSAGSIVLISRARSSRALDRDHPQPYGQLHRVAELGQLGCDSLAVVALDLHIAVADRPAEPHSRLRVEAISSRATWFPARPTTTVTVLPRRPLRSRDTRTMPSPPARGLLRADAGLQPPPAVRAAVQPPAVGVVRLGWMAPDDCAGRRGRRRIIQYTQRWECRGGPRWRSRSG